MKAALILAKTLLLRLSRDPMTIIVLLAIPVILVVAFGFFLGNTNDISLKVAVVNQSETAFSKEFTQQLGTVKVLKQPDETPATLDDAKTLLRDNKIDAIIELPADFGTTTTGVPRGTGITHFD